MPSTINADNGVVSGSSGVKTTADTSGVLALQSNGSTGVTLNTSLNVGIGTTTPGAKLQVTTGGSNSPAGNLSGNLGQFTAAGGLAYITMGNGDSANQHRYIGGASAIQVFGKVTDAGSTTEQMRLDASGSLLLGSTTDGGGRFQMTGNYARLTDGAYAGYIGKGSDLVVGAAASDLAVRSDSNLLFSIGSSEKFRIGTSGQLGIGGATYGTSGQVLTSGGSSAAPTWASPSGGSLIFLSEVTASNSSTVDIETTFDSTYDEYVIKVTNLIPETSNTGIRARVKIGGVYDDTSNYSSASTVTQSSGDSYTGNDGGTTMFLTTSFAGANRPTSFEFLVHNPSSTSYAKGFNWSGLLYRNGATLSASFVGAGLNSSTSACTGVRFYMTADRIVSGTFRLYGIKKS